MVRRRPGGIKQPTDIAKGSEGAGRAGRNEWHGERPDRTRFARRPRSGEAMCAEVPVYPSDNRQG
jgi:hypothetical protein